MPFEIPDNWVWTRFSQIASFELGKTPDRHTDKFWNNGIYPWFAISDLQERSTVFSTKEKISATALKEKFAGKLVPQGTLLMSFKLTVGRTSILGVDAVHNEAIISVFPIIPDKDATRNFLFNLLPLIVEYVETTDAIKGATLNSSKLSSMLVPFPPLTEQIRIVAEIEKFEPLIAEYDKLEQQATKLDEEIYDKIKKSILQYAIQGKLVPQDPNDEPASVLLEHIRAEKKAKLGKKYVDSYIYKGDDNCYYEKVGTNEPVRLDNLTFDIPDSWCWARLGSIGDWGAGATPARTNSQYYGGNIPWLKTGELNNDTVYDSEEHITDDALQNCSLRYCHIGDVLIAMYGATIGKLAIAGVPLTTNQACCACTPYEGIYNLYLFYFLMEERDNFIQMGFGGAQPNISKEKIIKHLFPVPPYEEQKRIVSTFIEIQNKLKDED